MAVEADVAFLFIGGVHQVAHLAPVAAELSRSYPHIGVRCLCADAETAAAIREVGVTSGAPDLAVVQLRTPRVARLLATAMGRRAAAKGPILAVARWHVRNCAAVVVPERTSAALRRMGWRRPLIHFRHGAGDRAPRSERRLKAFDLIVVPGRKDVDRAVAQGVDPDRIRAIGYVKLDYMATADTAVPRLFGNDRPIVLFNPHFSADESSLGIARDVIARFAAQDRYNLIYAPHIRAAENLSPGERAAWMALAVPDRIIVDLGSPRLFDMTYTRAADLYLGDLSSQLYEFWARPRPAVFVDAHGLDWRDDPRFAGWRLGVVARGADAVLGAVDRAFAGHAAVAARQAEATALAFGDYRGAIGRGAAILADAARRVEPAPIAT